METITLQQFIEKHGIRFTATRVNSRPDGLMDGDHMTRHFRCRLSSRGYVIQEGKHKQPILSASDRRAMGLYFSQGSAHTEEPTAADVLDCLASDASSYENAAGFEDWASEYGHDTDSRKAEKTYRTVKRQAEQLKRTIGKAAYEELLWNTERL